MSETSSPGKARRPVNISYSTHPNAQTSLRLSTARPFACSGLMYAAVPRIIPTLRHAGVGDVGEIAMPCLGACRSSAFARPKSSTFTVTVGAQLDVRGLQIAVNDALLVRGFERFGDLPRDRQRLSSGIGPCAIRSASVGPSTSSMTRARDAVRFFSRP